jgi:predicted DCC family thiol-disulfide oxidoreductase YuxK
MQSSDPPAKQPDALTRLTGFMAKPLRAESLAMCRLMASLALLYHVLFQVAPALWNVSSGNVEVGSFVGLWGGLGLWTLSLVALGLGWHTRFSAAIVFLFALAFPGAFGGLGDVPVQLSFYLLLVPAGAAWSLDALRHARRSIVDPAAGFESADRRASSTLSTTAAWPLRLLQGYVVANYLLLGHMLTHGLSGSWASGEFLKRALMHPEWARFAFEGSPSLALCQALTLLIVLWIALFPVLVFRPKTRAMMLRLGVLLHVSFFAFFDLAWSGHFLLCLYPLFVPGGALSDRVATLSNTSLSAPFVVAYDTFCPLCRRSRVMLERMDLGNRLRFMDIHDRETMAHDFSDVTYAQCLEELQVKHPDGTVTGGYFAFRTLTRILPALRLVRLVFFVPGVSLLGQRVYRWVAKHRYRLVDCSSEVCNLHVQALSKVDINEQEIAAIVARARQAAHPG